MIPGALRLSAYVSALLVGTVVITLAVVGSGIGLVMASRVTEDNQRQVEQAAGMIAERTAALLSDIEARVYLAGQVAGSLPAAERQRVLKTARAPNLDAVYMVDGRGRLMAASIAGFSHDREAELRGIDLSHYAVFNLVKGGGTHHWSDQHTSAVSGVTTIGLGIPVPETGTSIFAELPASALLKVISFGGFGGPMDIWVVDSKGEIIADSNPLQAARVNLSGHPVVVAGMSGQALPERMDFAGTSYHVSAAYSEPLGWLFVARIPAGLQNPRLREVVITVTAVLLGTIGVGAMLAPLWARGLAQPLRFAAAQASRLANGLVPEPWPRSRISELNQLVSDMHSMADAITSREDALRNLNEQLEHRVAERTTELQHSNRELSQALAAVELAKDELIQSEKMAALGRLVAGIAHELNTPIGNCRMAISTIADRLRKYSGQPGADLQGIDIPALLKMVTTGIDIAEQNMLRAGGLIRSFKQVAADRTASQRRRFRLVDVVQEVTVTLSPSLKRTAIRVAVEVDEAIMLDSFPGAFGQVLTNLIDNAAVHAFAGRSDGEVVIRAATEDAGMIHVSVTDNGQGMPADVLRRAFDPFFTTALGRGGTGLGLFIAYNAVTSILGGTISAESRPGLGTVFDIRIPASAPDAPAIDEADDAAMVRPAR
jgi:signal transduction histidine kinase